jgi:hypothetical protein
MKQQLTREQKQAMLSRQVSAWIVRYNRKGQRISREQRGIDPSEILDISERKRLPKGVSSMTHGMLSGYPVTYVELNGSIAAAIWQNRYYNVSGDPKNIELGFKPDVERPTVTRKLYREYVCIEQAS